MTEAELLHGVAPLTQYGFSVTGVTFNEASFGNAHLTMTRADVAVRLTCERGSWFVEVASVLDSEEWFDISFVLAELGITPSTALPSLESRVALLVNTFERWIAMFSPDKYPASRQRLRRRESRSAEERFGYKA